MCDWDLDPVGRELIQFSRRFSPAMVPSDRPAGRRGRQKAPVVFLVHREYDRGFSIVNYTSWTMAISAASPRRGPIFTTRV